jgi:hypothetical protein
LNFEFVRFTDTQKYIFDGVNRNKVRKTLAFIPGPLRVYIPSELGGRIYEVTALTVRTTIEGERSSIASNLYRQKARRCGKIR